MLPVLVGSGFAILLFGLLLRRIGQPSILAYLLAGVALGPSGLAVVEDAASTARVGEVGVVLLLFTAGMEVHLPSLAARWKAPVFGTFLQVAGSVGCAVAIGAWKGWEVERVVLVGFVISLSSTAVVLKLLRDQGELEQRVGKDVVAILLAQDFAVIPMLITVAVLGGAAPGASTILGQALGGAAAIGLLVVLANRREVSLPFGSVLRGDPELQVFAALLLGLGLAFVTGIAGLSVALGAFLAGIIVGAAQETKWVHEAVFPFQVVFLAVFFVSVGLLIDLKFIGQRAALIITLLVAVVLTNTLLNAVIFRIVGHSWRSAIYGGAMLSQVGEFSFVLAAIGLQTGLIEEFSYQVTVAVIALSLLVSPAWIAVARQIRGRATGELLDFVSPPPHDEADGFDEG